MYIRKTRDVFVVEGNYGYGWDELTREETWADAKAMLKCYRENEPQFGHRIVKHRERT